VIESAKAMATPPAANRVRRVASSGAHPRRRSAAWPKRGFLTLTRLVVESYEREEYLLFSGFDDSGASLDQETMEKLFGCSGRLQT
jgi:hypothetical protein